jgi:hypothetical protein
MGTRSSAQDEFRLTSCWRVASLAERAHAARRAGMGRSVELKLRLGAACGLRLAGLRLATRQQEALA